MAIPDTIFLIGASGFTGGYLLEALAQSHPDIRLLCLLRNVTGSRIADLKALNPNIGIVEGTLEDFVIISKIAKEVGNVIHVAHSDHWPSVSAVLDGLKKRAVERPEERPLYLHMSGCGIIADNARGEKVNCPPENTHLESDRAIFEAGTKGDNPMRTLQLFPCLIYGIGKTQRSGMWIPIFSSLAQNAGHAGTWGPGEVTQYCIHVRDVVSAVIRILDEAFAGKVQGGKDGLFFVTTKEPTMTWNEIISILGDKMYAKGQVKEPGSKPFPPEVTEPLGHYGWSLLGSNGHARADKLAALGWEPEWTRKIPLRDVLPEMIERGIEN